MSTYGSSLATVVAIVVVVAAAAAVAAAAGLILASALRRRRLEAAATIAAEMLVLIRAEPGAHVGDRAADPRSEGRPPTVRELRPREWEWLLMTRSTDPGGIWALDELAGLPAELLDWAGRHGPPTLRAALPNALDLLAVDEDVRLEIATVGRRVDPSRPPDPPNDRVTPAEKQQRLRRLAAERRRRPPH